MGRSRTIRDNTGKAGDHKQKAKRKGLEGGGKKIRKKGRRGVLCCWKRKGALHVSLDLRHASTSIENDEQLIDKEGLVAVPVQFSLR